MKTSSAPSLYLALIHYPVLNKGGEVVASAVTNLDLHDIARVGKTYGVRAFYVVTPLTDQQALVESIIAHWVSGHGSQYNRLRGEAMQSISVKNDFDQVRESIHTECGVWPTAIMTSARARSGNISFDKMRQMLQSPTPYLLTFGTGWGLAPEIMRRADFVLDPIRGTSEYNHLSVRSAVAIILDRLLVSS